MSKRWALSVAVWLTGALVGGLLMMGGGFPAYLLWLVGLAWLGGVVWGAMLHEGRGYWIHIGGSVTSLTVFPILWPLAYMAAVLISSR